MPSCSQHSSPSPTRLEEGGGHAVHKHGALAREVLHCVAQLDDLVAVHAAHPRIDVPAQGAGRGRGCVRGGLDEACTQDVGAG